MSSKATTTPKKDADCNQSDNRMTLLSALDQRASTYSRSPQRIASVRRFRTLHSPEHEIDQGYKNVPATERAVVVNREGSAGIA
ncbi:hypothetical protein [Nonomuraea sp. NPDC052265]|uniref:hypothetical protein n=1 Tax=Nonomuraea sp. NPDC052265 TaxID=3364374 RepID=UPI0037C8525C